MGAATKKRKQLAKVVERAKALAAPARPVLKPQAQERKAKVIAALKRLHPMD